MLQTQIFVGKQNGENSARIHFEFLMPVFLEGGVGDLVTVLLLLIILFSLLLGHFGIKVIKPLSTQEKVARDLCSTSQQLINYHQAERGLEFSVVFLGYSVI